MWPSRVTTVIETSARGAVAGPLTTEPSSREKALPWQLQGISPSLDALTEHPWWVQVALNALKSPSVGWVTTTFSASNTAQPPTGMSDVLASAAPLNETSSISVWLFYVQHQHEHAYWERDAGWSFQAGAMEGSSHLDLPPVLRWFTANIGVHHVHHLCSRIPSYRLAEVLRDHPELRETNRLTLRRSLRCFCLALWDEDERRLVSFREARRLARGQGERHSFASTDGTAQSSFAARTATTAGA